MTPEQHAKAIEDAARAWKFEDYPDRNDLASLRAAIRDGVGAAPPKDSAEFALAALVAAGHVSKSKVDYARALMPPPESKAEQHDSDCAKHNAPAYPPGPCDCSLSKAAPESANEMRTQDSAFKDYLAECEECLIVPDVAGAFNAAWKKSKAAPKP